jgi:hypothetical protein
MQCQGMPAEFLILMNISAATCMIESSESKSESHWDSVDIGLGFVLGSSRDGGSES